MNKAIYILSFLLLINPLFGFGGLVAGNCCSSDSIEQVEDILSGNCHSDDIDLDDHNKEDKDNSKSCCSDMCSCTCCHSPVIAVFFLTKTDVLSENTKALFIHFNNYHFSLDSNAYHPPKLV